LNATAILTPNSEFERREELTKLFYKGRKLSEKESAILNLCNTEEPECIGLIGCVLNDKSNLNNARLIIAYHNASNKELANKAKELLACTDQELELLIDEIVDIFFIESEDKTAYEDKVYTILFQLLK
jgi:hypothetical protein